MANAVTTKTRPRRDTSRPAARSAEPGAVSARHPGAVTTGRARRGRVFGALPVIVAAIIPLSFLAVFFLWPLARMVTLGLIEDGVWQLGAFGEVLTDARTQRVIGQTLLLALGATTGAILLGLPGAYVLYRKTFPGRGFLRAFITVPFVMPTVVVGVAFRSLLISNGPLGFLGLDETVTAVIAAMVFINFGVAVRIIGGMWAHLDPRAEEAARALGASPRRAFFTVTLPALGPALAAAASMIFLMCATAFGIVMVLGGARLATIETEIYVQTTAFLDLRTAAVLSIVQLLAIVAMLIMSDLFRRKRERALALGAPRETAQPLSRRDWFPVTVTAIVIIGLLCTPLISFVTRSFRTSSGWGLGNYKNLITSTGDGFFTVPVGQALMNSLRIALDATVIALLVGGLIAFVLSRRPATRWGRGAITTLDGLFMLPLGVSAVTVGFGFLVTLNQPPVDLRTSPILVPIAQAVVAIPLVVRTILPVLRAIDPRLREVAATLGAPPRRVLATLDFPLTARALGLAVGFAFAVAMGEFGATAFLSRPDSPTLPVVIFRLIGRPGVENHGTALAAAVVLAAATASAIFIAERLRLPGTVTEF